MHNVALEGLPIDWFGPLSAQLGLVSIFLRMCWLKTITGGWCTSVRFQTVQNRGCVFGCTDVRDELSHYLRCPILWQFACEAPHIREESISMLYRICLIDPSLSKFKTLAFRHALSVMTMSAQSQMVCAAPPPLYSVGPRRSAGMCCTL